jgi:hypothetical protein
MVYLAEDISIFGTWSKRGKEAEAFVRWKTYTYILCFEQVVRTEGGCRVLGELSDTEGCLHAGGCHILGELSLGELQL